jgi:hypothetical protein
MPVAKLATSCDHVLPSHVTVPRLAVSIYDVVGRERWSRDGPPIRGVSSPTRQSRSLPSSPCPTVFGNLGPVRTAVLCDLCPERPAVPTLDV